MRSLFWPLLAVAAVTSLGCPEKKQGPENGAPDATAAVPPKTGPGSIKGEVLFNGQVPPNEPLPKAASAACPQAPAVDEKVLVANGRLRNVAVRISSNAPPGGAAPAEPAALELKNCVYRPRVQGAVTGQALKITNGDATPHKVNAAAGTQSLFKEVLAPGAPALEKKLEKGGVVKVTCEAHPWEVGYVVVSDSKYITTTGDTGTFELKDVPPGSYVLEAWHEKFGTRTSAIEVKPGEATNVLFTFSP